MQRDEVIKALEVQPKNTDVQICVGGYLIDVDAVDFVAERDAIVFRIPADDLRDVIGHVASKKKWWRGALPGGLDTGEFAIPGEPDA